MVVAITYKPSGDSQEHSPSAKREATPLSPLGLPAELKMISSKDIRLLNSIGEGNIGIMQHTCPDGTPLTA